MHAAKTGFQHGFAGSNRWKVRRFEARSRLVLVSLSIWEVSLVDEMSDPIPASAEVRIRIAGSGIDPGGRAGFEV
jgi:hypothetical protein